MQLVGVIKAVFDFLFFSLHFDGYNEWKIGARDTKYASRFVLKILEPQLCYVDENAVVFFLFHPDDAGTSVYCMCLQCCTISGHFFLGMCVLRALLLSKMESLSLNLIVNWKLFSNGHFLNFCLHLCRRQQQYLMYNTEICIATAVSPATSSRRR